jgi:hypothetical protein
MTGCPIGTEGNASGEINAADAVAWYLLNNLAHTGTKVVLGLPDGDIVVTAEEGSTIVGRDLRTTAAG